MPKLNKLTESELVDLYVNQKKSLGDIAKLYEVSGQLSIRNSRNMALYNVPNQKLELRRKNRANYNSNSLI